MPFTQFFGQEAPQDTPKIIRTGVRAIIREGEKILMMKSKRGDVKFPGGGVESGEEEIPALLREIKEETGFIDVSVKSYLGSIIQSKQDRKDPSSWYVQTSPYYEVELRSNKQVEPELTEKEIREGYHLVWMTIQEAIKLNETVEVDPNVNGYIERENWVLNYLIEKREL
ncbi:NUDIX domain-containing protein [Paenisporosarcina cavernae]|uniref:NUDIX domain-containing protein n=1 Tax=Paenisporosarcina cavernae TaxID=2320858 RepID=A0A385YPU6_9BACL|nr:NUDIX domain-containing protein [Paenisporosarcina cavernae]AYC28471.1 NUDIX domain-containing protein [Paenisporosarcina cavernae]